MTLIRADEVDDSGEMEPITIGANSNIQDGVFIHCKFGGAVTIGEFSFIAAVAVGKPTGSAIVPTQERGNDYLRIKPLV